MDDTRDQDRGRSGVRGVRVGGTTPFRFWAPCHLIGAHPHHGGGGGGGKGVPSSASANPGRTPESARASRRDSSPSSPTSSRPPASTTVQKNRMSPYSFPSLSESVDGGRVYLRSEEHTSELP